MPELSLGDHAIPILLILKMSVLRKAIFFTMEAGFLLFLQMHTAQIIRLLRGQNAPLDFSLDEIDLDFSFDLSEDLPSNRERTVRKSPVEDC